MLRLEDLHLRRIVQANAVTDILDMPGLDDLISYPHSMYGVYAHLSPDGTRIAYSTCEYDTVIEDGFGLYRVGQEIATIDIDGTDRRRLTDNVYLDHYPVWSPDGTRLAHVVGEFEPGSLLVDTSIGYDRDGTSLTIRPLEGISPADSTREFILAGLYPPAWSPDGTRIAFVSQQQLTDKELRSTRLPEFGRTIHNPNPQFIYTIRPSGKDQVRIAESSTPPTWSPDSQQLAFSHTDATSSISAIYVASVDGTDIHRIWESEADEPFPIKRISWSPDGSELLVVSGHLWTIGPDGNGVRQLATSTLQVAPDEARRDPDGSVWVTGPDYERTEVKDGSPIPRFDLDDAIWSSDGSRIAVYGWDHDRKLVSFRIITMDRDGTDVRVVVKADVDRGIHAPVQPRHEGSADSTP